MPQPLLPPPPPAKRGTALIAAGLLLTFSTIHAQVYGHWLTYLPSIFGLVVCYTGVYLNIRKPRE